jgi:hypothetical protein
MRPTSFDVLALLAAGAAAFVWSTLGHLPERVATHFGASNLPNGWMTRDFYLGFMLVFMVALPLAVTALIGVIPRVAPGSTNLPNRDYWLAPERRADSLLYLRSHGGWLGCILVGLGAGIHGVLLVANRSQPPLLPLPLFLVLMGGFLLAIALWVVALYRRFPRPDAAP